MYRNLAYDDGTHTANDGGRNHHLPKAVYQNLYCCVKKKGKKKNEREDTALPLAADAIPQNECAGFNLCAGHAVKRTVQPYLFTQP